MPPPDISSVDSARHLAVCFRGGWRSFGRTAPVLHAYVLEPLDAAAFAVLEVDGDAHRRTEMANAMLGRGTVEVRVNTSDTLYGNSIAKHFFDSSAYERLGKRHLGNPIAYRAMSLQRIECFRMMTAPRRSFSIYACVRSDLMLFEPLPAKLLRRLLSLNTSEAIVPSGDDWGPSDDPGLNDNLFFGGFDAMRADASQWREAQSLADSNSKWISEVVLRQAVARRGIVLYRVPVAYCKVDERGACRYFAQLAASIALIGTTLLQTFPESAHLLCDSARGPCTSQNASLSLHVQTQSDYLSDPNWCQLIDVVESVRSRGKGVCGNGWGGKAWLQHR